MSSEITHIVKTCSRCCGTALMSVPGCMTVKCDLCSGSGYILEKDEHEENVVNIKKRVKKNDRCNEEKS